MADLLSFLASGLPKAINYEESPEEQLLASIGQHMKAPNNIEFDGKIHRFKVEKDEGGEKSGWYVAFSDEIHAASYGNWRIGKDWDWHERLSRSLSQEEKDSNLKRMEFAKQARESLLHEQYAEAAKEAVRLWDHFVVADPEHPYLIKKQCLPHFAKVSGDGRLAIPVFGAGGDLASLQFISASGGKLFLKNSQAGSGWCSFGEFQSGEPVFLCEGFATGATIYEVTGHQVFCALSSHNIIAVAAMIRNKFPPGVRIIIAADNDESGVGEKHAKQAADLHGADVKVCPILGDMNDFARRDGGDLKALLMPQTSGWLIPANEFFGQPAPVRWLIKNWLQADALIMLQGPSGARKSYIMLDMCLRLAAGVGDWMGHRCTGGPVIYLAGEGHHGMRGRGAAWLQHHKKISADIWISDSGLDLNTPAGYAKTVQAIQDIGVHPCLIVVDTLHRFLNGDDSKSQDAKGMLDAFAHLMREFGCSVAVVHHAGLNLEAQGRGRGSSAWRGAMDIEISVTTKKDEPTKIEQVKAKDSEPAEAIYVEFETITIDGWMDEDGQPVTNQVPILASQDAAEEAKKAEEAPSKKDSSFEGHVRRWERAWFATDCDLDDGMPYVSKSGISDFLVTNDGVSPKSISTTLSPDPKRFIGILLNSQFIKARKNGWVAINPPWVSSLLMRMPK